MTTGANSRPVPNQRGPGGAGGALGRHQLGKRTSGWSYHCLARRGLVPPVDVALVDLAALHAVGGFSEDTLAEDTDVTMALHRGGWDVGYEPRAIAYTGLNPMYLADKDGSQKVIFVGIWYHDEWRRTDDGWRISKRAQQLGYFHGL